MNKFHIVREDGSEFECESEADLQFLQESHPEWKVSSADEVKEEKPKRASKKKE